MRISIGGDHAGPALKKILIDYLNSKGIECLNRGTDEVESVDYPDFAHAVASDVSSELVDFGILICGSANGVAMTANKHQNIRAGLAWNVEVAKLIKQHNNANVLCIPARFVGDEDAINIVQAYMDETFEGGRHERRIQKIMCAWIAAFISCAVSIQGFTQTIDGGVYAETITASDLENHLMVLASDAFEGRETGEPGAEKAAQYIASHFESIGIAPYNQVNYFQPVPFKRSQIQGGSASTGDQKFVFLDDYLFYPGIQDDVMENVPMVLVTKEAEWELEELKGGMIVIPLSPKDGQTNWQQGLNDIRVRASEKGARGVIVVGEGLSIVSTRMKPWLTRKSLSLIRTEVDEVDGTRIPTFFVEAASTESWWKATPLKSWKKWVKNTQKGKAVSGGLMPGIQWNFSIERTTEGVAGKNVLGYIPGRDSILAEEVVVITAHYDHVGIIDGEIHNGADDDGSGTVTVLELAEAFMESVRAGEGPRRSVLLMTVVGEEKGLLGSEWYADHPIYPLEKTVANLNIDMIGRVDENHTEDNRYVYLIGSDKLSTELHEISEKANEKYTQLALDYTFNAPDDPNRFYYRSDHYNFAKNNIPVIFYFSGVHEDYHRPGDDPEKIMYDKTAEIGKLVFHTAWQLANQDKRIEVNVVNDFPER